jgi:hypothetical protein
MSTAAAVGRISLRIDASRAAHQLADLARGATTATPKPGTATSAAGAACAVASAAAAERNSHDPEDRTSSENS